MASCINFNKEIETNLSDPISGLDGRRLLISNKVCCGFMYADHLMCNMPKEAINLSKIKNVLDVGCGVGPLSIYFALQRKSVTALDINPEAIKFTKMNVDRFVPHSNLKAIQGDISNVQLGKYDLIVSNPPLDEQSYMRPDIQQERIEIERRFQNGVVDSAIEDYLTNCWHDDSGKDVADWLFIRGKSLLTSGGKMLFVCGDDFRDNAAFITEKSRYYDSWRRVFCNSRIKNLEIKDGNETMKITRKFNILVFTPCNQ